MEKYINYNEIEDIEYLCELLEKKDNILKELEEKLDELIKYEEKCYIQYPENWEERKAVSNTWLTSRDSYYSVKSYLNKLKEKYK